MFDCRIFNADAISYVNTPITTLLENQRNDKKKQYNSAVEKRRGTFTPFIASCDAILDVEAEHYLKRLSSYLSEKWERVIQRLLVGYEQESKFVFSDQ